MLLFFIALGLFFGSDGVVKIPFENYAFAEQICSIALIFIMFYGGFGTNWEEAKPIAGKAVLLSTAGVILTCGFTGLFCRWVLGMAWLESLLIGAVMSSYRCGLRIFHFAQQAIELKGPYCLSFGNRIRQQRSLFLYADCDHSFFDAGRFNSRWNDIACGKADFSR